MVSVKAGRLMLQQTHGGGHVHAARAGSNTRARTARNKTRPQSNRHVVGRTERKGWNDLEWWM